jgi:hypothetical protein
VGGGVGEGVKQKTSLPYDSLSLHILLLFISPNPKARTYIYRFFLNGHTKCIQVRNYDKTLEMCGTSSIR